MISNHSEENQFEDNEMVDTLISDQDEEQGKNNPAISEYGVGDAHDLSSYSDSDDNDDISHQLTSDLATDNAQTSVPNAKQISISLALFRHRHNLSKSCANHLCDLLRCLGVQNVPSDFRCIERNIIQKEEKILQS